MSQVIKEAEKLLNTPYKPMGYDERGLDCLGFVALVFYRCGRLPEDYWQAVVQNKDSYARNRILFDSLSVIGERKNRQQIEPEDILIYKVKGISNPTHLALVTAPSIMIHAHSGARKVCKTNIYHEPDNMIVGVFRIK
jgi:cell wall-associated NlpC family hydrolase